MSILNIIQTYWTTDHPQISQVARITTTQDAGGSVLWLHDAAGGSTSSLTLAAGLVSGTDFQHVYHGATQSLRSVDFKGTTRGLDETLTDQVLDGAGATTTYLDRVGVYDNTIALAAVEDYLFVSATTGSGISGYFRQGDGSLTLTETISDTAETGLENIVSMATGSNFIYDTLVTVSGSTDTISLFYIDAAGQLTLQDDTGPVERLPISTPTGIDLLTLEGQSFVIVAASGSNSLSVLSVGRNGAMEFSDQVIDTQDTQFAGVSAIATTVWNGLGLVAAAGTDGGISLFQLLPTGRLILRDKIVDQTGAALGGVAQLSFVDVNDALQLVALSTTEDGITRLAVDLPSLGVVAQSDTGTAQADVLSAPASGGPVFGLGGDDILIDSFQADELWGGEGRDLFVFAPDTQPDAILDFDKSEDRIDLSAYVQLSDVTDIVITQTPDGLVLDLGQETLLLKPANGTTLTPADFTTALLFNATHVILSEPNPVQGSAANDMFYRNAGSSGRIDGGDGYDAVDYSLAGFAIVVALDGSRPNGGAAAGDSYAGVERVIATGFNDTVIGDDLSNMIEGGGGDDVIRGQSGADWLLPGAGRDTVDGGAGTDMVSYVDSTAGITADLSAGTVANGDGTDTLSSIEGLTGSIFDDYVVGDGGDNRLRGLGDYDWMVGSGGADSYDGGTGRDMVSYVTATSGVTVDLGAGRGLGGQATGDTYTSIERVTGSSFADLFYGSQDADDFRGLGGDDWFIGSEGGKDRYFGGSGRDTVSYSDDSNGVVASLLLGRGSDGQARSDLYFDIENLTGSSHNDRLTGDHGANTLRGLSGSDVLYGNGGNDRLTGGGSDDVLDGGSGWDYAYYHNDASAYEISTVGRYTYVDQIGSGGDGRDLLINIEVLVFADTTILL